MIVGTICWVHRHHTITPCHCSSLLFRNLQITCVFSALAHALLISAVAINFPSGLVVGMVYVIVAFCVVGWFVFQKMDRSGGSGSFATLPLLHSLLLAYVITLFIILIWIGFIGGLEKRSNALE
jgi:lysylphosphatidylglycerol synthetase-like protein (DUF2156 family)